MKKLILMAAVAAMTLSSCGSRQITMSDKEVSRTVAVESSFDAIETSCGIKVEYTPTVAGAAEVEITAPDNVIDYVEAEVKGATLQLGIKPGTSLQSNATSAEIRVRVAAPGVYQFEANSSGRIDITPSLKADKVEIEASSSGAVNIKEITAEKADIEVSSSGVVNATLAVNELKCEAASAGVVTLSGSAGTADYEAMSAGVIEAAGVKAGNGRASASSAATVRCSIASPSAIEMNSAGRVVNN